MHVDIVLGGDFFWNLIVTKYIADYCISTLGARGIFFKVQQNVALATEVQRTEKKNLWRYRPRALGPDYKQVRQP